MDCGSGAVGADGYCEQCGLRQPSGREHVESDLGRLGAAVSDLGLRRSRNEDAFALAALPAGACAVVCDGVATAPGSEEASRVAAETAVSVLTGRVSVGMDPRGAMRAAVARAAEAVAGLPGDPESSPACTFVSAVVDASGVTVGWVGDSRAYWLSATGSCRLSTDDSWAANMIEQGTMTAADAWADKRAHLLTAWLGADAGPVEPHVTAFRPTRWGDGGALQRRAVERPAGAVRPRARGAGRAGRPARRGAQAAAGGARRGRARQRHGGGDPLSTAGTDQGAGQMSDFPEFTIRVDQNPYLPAGGREMHAIVSVEARSSGAAPGRGRAGAGPRRSS
ncbi:PP2C family protein-serine/threonine phosphatase [Actinomadura madurae]|uniref:PP2C family protein-serine/threonine phosphatase n=1 Tax=Actinomadura madurae TaxID=1993 RepID=UPI0020D21987|nr:protein phosphatase 2C domain-containing protein [Actinomadura madurae]MCP9980856.1 protein phosphatase 2C domain-containing protein [Actinomadura madurae]